MLVVAVVAISLIFFLPAFQNWIQRARVEGFAKNVTFLVHQARSLAVRDSTSVVIALDEDNGEIFSFFDRSGVAPGSPGDGIYNPIDGAPPGTTDQRVASRFLPAGMDFVAPKNQDVVDGLTAIGGDRVAIFEPDGSIRETGAFRFGDTWGNYLEVRIGPAATARVTMAKFVNLPGNNDKWLTRDAGPWEWYWGKSRKKP